MRMTTQPSAASWFNQGSALQSLGRCEEAAACYRKVLEVDAGHAGACLRLGSLLFPNDQEAGIGYLQRAHDADRSHAGARKCLALGYVAVAATCSARSAWQEMFDAFDRALDVAPDHAGAHWNLAWELLRHGRLSEGWSHYEWRWKWDGFGDRPRGFPQPQWDGACLEGKRILLHAEQGLGDAIQFARYAPLVAARGGRVVLEVPRPLVRLMGSLDGVETVLARGDRLPAFDCHCPLMSLPHVFGTTLETIPSEVPYLSAPRRAPAVAGQGSGRLRSIGLVWAGSPGHARDERRSIALDLFAPLTQIEGLRWHSLQKGPAAAALVTPPPGLTIVNLGASIGDFADTAAMVASLDLVISVDTSVAHLAGALGTPVWILVPAKSDWRWLIDRDDSPWYPTARLFRQHTERDWGSVVDQVRHALRNLPA
jgi:hypothetical protein